MRGSNRLRLPATASKARADIPPAVPRVRRMLTERIRGHRVARGWTQRDLAARAGIAFATYRAFERTGRISLDRFLRVLDILNLLGNGELVPPVESRAIDEITRTVPAAARPRARAKRDRLSGGP